MDDRLPVEGGPNHLARTCRHKIEELESTLKGLPQFERKAINQDLHQLRQLLKFAITRAGYVDEDG